MFTIEIAGIPIGIRNHYILVKHHCREYLTEKKPLFTVGVSMKEIRQEKKVMPGYAESLCVYREIAREITAYDAFVMHAAVISADGQGVAFSAKSGVGKTTRVQMWQKAMGDRVRVINGDKPVLRFVDGKLYAFGTPWLGKERMGENTSVPMKAVCFLERSEMVSLQRLKPAEIASRLLLQVLIPKEADQIGPFMNLMERFVKAVPFYLLKCNSDREDPEVIWKQIRKDTEEK